MRFLGYVCITAALLAVPFDFIEEVYGVRLNNETSQVAILLITVGAIAIHLSNQNERKR